MWIEMVHEAHAYSFAITFLCMEHERNANLFRTIKRKGISQCIYAFELLFVEYPTDGREFGIKRQRGNERKPNKWNEML